jgi:hypothetical protein
VSLPNREFQKPSGLPITVDELYGIMRLRAFKSTGFPVNILAENDGTLRSQSILFHSGTTQIRQKAETDGTALSSLYGKNAGTLTSVGLEVTGEQRNIFMGHDGAALQRVKTETSRELAVTNYSKTSTPAVVANRADAAGFPRTREFEPYEGTAVVAIQTTATTIYTAPANTVAVVEIEISNTDTVANIYDFHIIPSGGSAAIGNRMRTSTSIAAGGVDRLGPYIVPAATFFQALITTVAGANGDLNAIAVVKEYGTGDAVALV